MIVVYESGVVEFQTTRNAAAGAASAHRLAQWGGTRLAVTRLGLGLTVSGWFTAIGLLLTVVGFALTIYFSSTPLEDWLFHGPFGRDKDKRYLPPERDGTEEWASWRNDAIAEHALTQLLFGFGLAYRHGAAHDAAGKRGIWLKIRVTVPKFEAGKSVLYHALEETESTYRRTASPKPSPPDRLRNPLMTPCGSRTAVLR